MLAGATEGGLKLHPETVRALAGAQSGSGGARLLMWIALTALALAAAVLL